VRGGLAVGLEKKKTQKFAVHAGGSGDDNWIFRILFVERQVAKP
jgi:hypothetical protein